jgi:thioredoxin 1
MAARIGKDNFTASVLESRIPVLVEFYSDSCIPCKQMSPILGAIEDDYEDQLKVYKVNVNFDTELAAEYGVMASPTLVFFKGGTEVERLRGLVTKQELLEDVEKVLEGETT